MIRKGEGVKDGPQTIDPLWHAAATAAGGSDIAPCVCVCVCGCVAGVYGSFCDDKVPIGQWLDRTRMT